MIVPKILQSVIDSFPDGICIYDSNYKICYANQKMIERFGNFKGKNSDTYLIEVNTQGKPYPKQEESPEGPLVYEWFDKSFSISYEITESKICDSQLGSLTILRFQDISTIKKKEQSLNSENLELNKEISKATIELIELDTDLEKKEDQIQWQNQILERFFLTNPFIDYLFR
jgi:hypothetical protein